MTNYWITGSDLEQPKFVAGLCVKFKPRPQDLVHETRINVWNEAKRQAYRQMREEI